MSGAMRRLRWGRDLYEWHLPEITGAEIRRVMNIPGGDDVFRRADEGSNAVGEPIGEHEVVPLPERTDGRASLVVVVVPRFIDGGNADSKEAKP